MELSLKKALGTNSKIDDIPGDVAWVYNDYGHSWLALVSLIMYSIVFIWSEEAMLKIWLRSVWVKASRALPEINGVGGLLMELIRNMGIPYWGWCHWWWLGLLRDALRKLCLKFDGNLLSFKGSRSLSKIDDIGGVDEDQGCSWLVLVTLTTFWMVPVFAWSLSFKFH